MLKTTICVQIPQGLFQVRPLDSQEEPIVTNPMFGSVQPHQNQSHYGDGFLTEYDLDLHPSNLAASLPQFDQINQGLQEFADTPGSMQLPSVNSSALQATNNQSDQSSLVLPLVPFDAEELWLGLDSNHLQSDINDQGINMFSGQAATPSQTTTVSSSRPGQRDTSKDDYLVRCKAQGMSYKQIKESGGFAEAESTLRGRYRALTKPKEARLRRPDWGVREVSACHACPGLGRTIANRRRSSFSSKGSHIVRGRSSGRSGKAIGLTPFP
jgi:hypothetical protein